MDLFDEHLIIDGIVREEMGLSGKPAPDIFVEAPKGWGYRFIAPSFLKMPVRVFKPAREAILDWSWVLPDPTTTRTETKWRRHSADGYRGLG
jgi:hypothetical protein